MRNTRSMVCVGHWLFAACGLCFCSAQYYQLLRLGRTGYARIMNNLDTIASRLADGILGTGDTSSQHISCINSNKVCTHSCPTV